MDRIKSLTGVSAGLILVFSAACSAGPIGRSATGGAFVRGDGAAGTVTSQNVIRFDNFSAGSKSDIMVIDPQGRKIGYDRDYGTEVNEVPLGSYSGREEAQQVAIRNPIAGNYTIVISGAEGGDFSAGISYRAERVVDNRDFRGAVSKEDPFFAIVELDPASNEPLQFALFQYYND